MFVICAAMFISAIDMTIVNVALPDISSDLGAGIGELQWVLDGFLVALAGLLLVGSGLADRFGRRRIFLSGMAGFGVTSILCALAPSPGALIGGRVLMGASAACVLPPALSLIAVMFSPEERPRALAVWTALAGLGFVLGPVLGGVLVSAAGWETVFLVNVPVVLVVVLAGRLVLPESTRPGTPPLDVGGAALSTVALGGIVFTLIEGPDLGWSSPLVIASGVIGVVSLIVFIGTELRRRYPLFDVRVLARPVVAAGALSIMSLYITTMGTLFLLPQYIQYVQDRSVVAAGLLLAPIGVMTAVGAVFMPRAQAALGFRVMICGGLVVMAGAMGLLVLLSADSGIGLPLASTILVGLMISTVAPPATAVIMDDLGQERAGDGGAVNQLARQVGGALGVAIIGSVFAAVYTNEIDEKLARLPAPRRDDATESIEDARHVVDAFGGALHDTLLLGVDDAFDVAARAGFGVAAVVLLAVAAFGVRALRPRPG